MSRPRLLDQRTIGDAAFERARHHGLQALTARGVAHQLGCSTQAVYTAYESMDRIRGEVRARAGQWVSDRLRGTGALPYRQLGIETLRLAHDEPHLFRMAAEVMRAGLGTGAGRHVRAAMRADARLARADDATLDVMHDVLSLLVLSLAESLTSDPGTFELAVARLTTAGEWIAAGVQATTA